MLAVRPYAPDDAAVTLEIFLCAIREVASRDYGPAEIEAWARVDDAAAWASRRLSRPTWIATVSGVPAGFSDLLPGGHLDMLFVHPRHGGRGVARRLLTTVEAAARGEGVDLLTVDASLTARAFFEKVGFIVVTAQEARRHGQRLRNFRMRKRLAG